ncbi:hypothetical protein TWF696_003451 [Orbilia brochopaga]|uniref:Uncharacterized protein n=1 Tax=Orbilia brochopaga TaxID=3140254 RepID=A0AAV9U1F2_9PEZI
MNGQEDNLAGLGGNFDYVKWNTMVLTSFVKQSQLGPYLQQLVRVHQPIQLHRELDEASGKTKRIAIMGKADFEKKYGTPDVGRLNRDRTEVIIGGTSTDESLGPPSTTVDFSELDRELDISETHGDDSKIPDWRKLNPPPVGTVAVPHPLSTANLYAGDNFLPLDAAGNWVPPSELPERDLRSLLDKDDPLYDILLRAANDIIREQKGEVLTPLPSDKETPKPPEKPAITRLLFEDPRILPNFSRRKWPALKKHLGQQRWHLIPVAFDINGELRWWLMVIDMQAQRRSGAAEKKAGKERQPHRASWVFDPCAAKASKPGDKLDSESIFLNQVPIYLGLLADMELKDLTWRETPVIFPLSNDVAGLRALQGKALPPDHYDLPGRFRHFEKMLIRGSRHNHNNRNPQTGVDIVHAMARVLRLIEMEDARLQPAWRHMNVDNLSCVSSFLGPAPTPSQREIDHGNDVNSLQNKVRTETMTEVHQYFNKAYLKAAPFRRDVPDRIPDLAYDILTSIYMAHPPTWGLITGYFTNGAHGVLVGMDFESCLKDRSCTNCHIVHRPMTLGTRIILHGKKPNHPFDNPKTEFWSNVAATEILEGLPDDEKDSKKIGCLYNRYRYLREDYETDGTIPRAGGPRDPTNVIEQEYPQSMISLIIDDNGQGFIHVGNRPNSVWTVNGAKVTQSELIDRFSHVTYLYGGGKHWLWLRRFATCESNAVQMEVKVPGDINTYQRPFLKKKRDGLEQAILTFPETTYLSSGAELKKLFYNMGHDTPHFHHHHRPTTKQLSQQEKYLWNSQVRDLFLCQNPACFQLSKRFTDKSTVKANFTSIPCFEPTCVNNLPETKFYGNVTCSDPVRHRCLPNTDGQLRGHLPGIPGHLFLETGVMLFQPELIISNSEGTINTRGASIPRPAASDDRSKNPQPPLSWSRISFTPVKRFPSVTIARRYLRAGYNYDPIILAAHESMGIAYDITMYERLSYYRLLFWNQLDAQTQRQQWSQTTDQRTKSGLFSTYSVSAQPEATLRIGYQPPQDRYASGTAGSREGTDRVPDASRQIIVGTGESWVWDLAHGHLPPGSLPWSKSPDASGSWTQTGCANAGKYVSAGKIMLDSGGNDMRNTQSTWPGHPAMQNEADKLAWIFGKNQRLQPIADAEKVSQMKGKSKDVGNVDKHGDAGQHTTLRSADSLPKNYSNYMKINLLSDPNSDIHIGAHDKLLPRVFCRLVPGGMVREECIQITKPDIPDPILVRVKQRFIKTHKTRNQNSDVGQPSTGTDEGSEAMEIDSPEAVTVNDMPAELSADEIQVVKLQEVQAHEVEQREPERNEEQTDELAVALSPRPPVSPKGAKAEQLDPSSSEIPVSEPVQVTSEPAEISIVLSAEEGKRNENPELPKKASPEKCTEPPSYKPSGLPKHPIQPKRPIEEVADPTPPPKKKRGRKKKIQPEDLPYTKKDMIEDDLKGDNELDIVPVEVIDREAGGRRHVARQAARKVAYNEDSD